jgi:hypothetical protein
MGGKVTGAMTHIRVTGGGELAVQPRALLLLRPGDITSSVKVLLGVALVGEGDVRVTAVLERHGAVRLVHATHALVRGHVNAGLAGLAVLVARVQLRTPPLPASVRVRARESGHES